MSNDIKSLAHTVWNCKYHVVFAPKYSVSGFIGYLKGKSSLLIYERWKNMEYKYRNREFWCRGYYVDTVGKNTAKIAEYIKGQLREDKLGAMLPFDKSPWEEDKKKQVKK